MNIVLKIIEEKNRIFDKLKQEVAGCMRCPELCNTKTQTVFGEGNINAKIMFIGEGPGHDEDLSGRPFVGRAGKLLSKIIEAHGLVREEVYICNILKCRPPQNRNPEPQEIINCSEYLQKQINVVNPKFIVCLGSVASISIVGLPINKARGKWFDYKGHKVLCTYHPSYALRNGENIKKEIRKDMITLTNEL